GSPEGQVGYGSPVEYGAWEPGDLVFFANTFREGVSHVGIATGGSQMVHAENESTGVTISDITSDYYTSHYYSAIRL
ncbi:MAG: C40 family peptidase, partial [Thermomicrobiales bacterium]